MKTKPFFGLMLLFMMVQLTFSQSKTFNGKFNSTNFQGYVTYNYTEQQDKRNFNGIFIFKTANNSVNISGNFLNDFKNGKWNFVFSNVSNTDFQFRYLISANVFGYFKNGNVDGNWNLTRTKVISFSNNIISEEYQRNLNAMSYLFNGKPLDTKKSNTVTEKSKANFKDNRFYGSFSYNVNDGKSTVNGQFNENGYFDGDWIINYFKNGILHFQTRTYLKGVLLTIKNKDNSTGEVTKVYDKTIEVNEFFQNYNSTENFSKIGNNYYVLKEDKTSDNDVSFLEDAISIWYNNTSLSNSAYIYEIERGTNKLDAYPERIIRFDFERTEKAKQEEERIAEEKSRQEEAAEENKRQLKLAKEKQEQEIILAEERKVIIFKNSDYGKIQKSIKTEFNTWEEKGEFETQLDYEKRISTISQVEFDKIVQSHILKSKKNKENVLSGTLSGYNIDTESFELSLFSNTSGSSYKKLFLQPILIKIPKTLAPILKIKFGGDKAEFGEPILVHCLDFVMSNNNWIPSHLILILSNSEETKSIYSFNTFDRTIIEQKNKKYILAVNWDKSKNIILRPIDSQFKNNTLDTGVFYYEWFLDGGMDNNLNFSIENLKN